MHPGGGDILTSEVSSQEAAAAVAFAVQQQQSYQLSLSRANAVAVAESGKWEGYGFVVLCWLPTGLIACVVVSKAYFCI